MRRLLLVTLVLSAGLYGCSDNKGGGSPGSDDPQLPPAPTSAVPTP